MGANSQQAFTTDKLKKFGASGNNGNVGQRDRDKAATSDDYGRSAAKTSDCSAFATGGAAKAPSLGRAARAAGGRIARADGGKTRDISKVSDGGPKTYGDRPLIRAKGGRVGKQLGGALPPDGATPPGMIAPPPAGQLPGLPGLGRAKGGRIGRAEGGKAYGPQQDPDWREWHDDEQGHTSASGGRLTPFEKFSVGMWDKSSMDPRNWGSSSPDPNEPSPARARGGRVGLKRGGKAKGKGKTVVNVIVGHGQGQQPPAPPPMAAPGPVPPPMPPPHPAMLPPGGPPGAGGPPPMGPPPGAPMGPMGAPPGGPPGLPPGIHPGMLPGRASGGRISQKFGAGSGQGRMQNAKRSNSGKVELAE